jgi:hypothetical protein
MPASASAHVRGRRRAGAGHPRGVRLRARWRLVPWWGRALIVFALSRIPTTAILLAFAAGQDRNHWTGASPDYFSFAGIWDGEWYQLIAVSGYPSELPRSADGLVTQNAWAFMPAYPGLVRLLVLATGAPFDVVASLLSVAFAAAAAVAFWRLMATVMPGGPVLFATVLFCVAPLSPILQVAYAEPMQLLLICVALLLVVERRYVVLLPVIVLASLTRPSGLALALFLGLHVVHRLVTRRRDPFPPRELAAAVVAGAVAVVAGFAWLLVAWAVTGEPGAYTDTELAWRVGYVGAGHLVPFTPWLQGADWWFRWIGLPGWLGQLTLVAAVAAGALAMLLPAVRRIGVDLRLWVIAYLVYLLAVFFPQSSTFRLLMPAFPLLGAFAQPTSRVVRVLLVVACLVGQVLWVGSAWAVDSYDWTPP